jgi:hypothetical protein
MWWKWHDQLIALMILLATPAGVYRAYVDGPRYPSLYLAAGVLCLMSIGATYKLLFGRSAKSLPSLDKSRGPFESAVWRPHTRNYSGRGKRGE